MGLVLDGDSFELFERKGGDVKLNFSAGFDKVVIGDDFLLQFLKLL